MISSNRLLILLVAVFMALAMYYSVTTPIFEAPDEIWHYQFIREIAVNHGLPVVNPEIKQTFAHEGLQPPLYYTLGAMLIAWMNPHDLAQVPAPNPYGRIGEPAFATNDNRNLFLHTDAEAFPYHGVALAVHLLRLYSVLLGAGTIIFTFLLAREIFPLRSSQVSLLAASFVAFLPQFLFISGAISNDNLATLLSVTSLWQIARMMHRGTDSAHVLVLGLLVGGAALAKLSTIALIPLALLVLAYLTWQKRAWRTGTKIGAIFLVAFALVAGWWYARNLQLYGDFFPFTPLAQLVGTRPTTLDFMRWLRAEGEGLRLSTWGVFGWFNISAAPQFYLFYDALAALGLLGILYALARRQNLSLRLALLPLWIGLCFIAFWRYASFIITTQGRLLFPALPAWAILWAWGIVGLVPLRFHFWVKGALGTAMFASAMLAPMLFIAPAYTPTIAAENQLPTNLTRLGWRFENGIEWLGVSLDRTRVRPGESRALTIYQRLPASAARNEAIFIHLVNSADVIIAQRDSLIGSGNLRAWSDSVTVADTYRVTVPVTVPNGTAWRVQAGIYDPATGKRFVATDGTGKSLGDELTLATIPVERASAEAWRFDFSSQATLVSADFSRESVNAGDTLTLTLQWRDVKPNYHVFVHALGERERIWASADAPIDNTRPTQIELRFDPAMPAGIYPLELGVYVAPDGDRLGVFDAQGQDMGDRIFLGPVRVIAK